MRKNHSFPFGQEIVDLDLFFFYWSVMFKVFRFMRGTLTHSVLLRQSPLYAEGIWNRSFHSENASNVFHPHYARGIWKRQSLVVLDWGFKTEYLEGVGGGGYLHDCREVILFKCSLSTRKRKVGVFKLDYSGLKSVFRFRDGLVWTVGLTVEIKFCFRDGLVWTVGLTMEIKLRFQIYPAKCRRGLNFNQLSNTHWLLCTTNTLQWKHVCISVQPIFSSAVLVIDLIARTGLKK